MLAKPEDTEGGKLRPARLGAEITELASELGEPGRAGIAPTPTIAKRMKNGDDDSYPLLPILPSSRDASAAPGVSRLISVGLQQKEDNNLITSSDCSRRDCCQSQLCKLPIPTLPHPPPRYALSPTEGSWACKMQRPLRLSFLCLAGQMFRSSLAR